MHAFHTVGAGVVTAVAVQCAPRPASVQLAFLQCPSYSHVLRVLMLVGPGPEGGREGGTHTIQPPPRTQQHAPLSCPHIGWRRKGQHSLCVLCSVGLPYVAMVPLLLASEHAHLYRMAHAGPAEAGGGAVRH